MRARHGLKRCSYCRAVLSSSAFNAKASTKDGLQDACRRCRSIQLYGHDDTRSAQTEPSDTLVDGITEEQREHDAAVWLSEELK